MASTTGSNQGDRIHPLRVLADGFVAGLCGATAAAGTHFGYDVLTGDALRTPAVLAALVFQGVEAAPHAVANAEALARYTALHVGLWLLMGGVSSYLISIVDVYPRLASWVFGGIAFFFISALYAAGAFSIPEMEPLHLWLGTLFGAGATAGYLALRHPKLVGHLQRTHLADVTKRHLTLALAHEVEARAIYRCAAERFEDAPSFREVLQDRERRVATLAALVEHFDLTGQEAPAKAPEIADSLEDALSSAVARERRTVELYDRFLASESDLRARNVFLRHRYGSYDLDIPIFLKGLTTLTEGRTPSSVRTRDPAPAR